VTVRLALSALILYLAAGVAQADDDPTRALELARQATALAGAGDYAGALPLYKEALALDGRPEYRCNVGAAYYRLQSWPAAHLHLSMCLTHAAVLDADYVARMSAAFAYSEEQLRDGGHAQLRIEVQPPDAMVRLPALDADEAFAGSRMVWLAPGEHRVEVSAAGHLPAATDIRVAADGTLQVVSIALERAPVSVEPPVADPAPKSPADAAVDPGSPVLEPGAPEHGPGATAGGGTRAGAWVAWSAAGAGLLVGAVAHADAYRLRRDLLASNDDRDRKVSRMERDQVILGVGYAAAALGAAAGTYLWVRASRRERAVLGAAPTPGGGAVWATIPF
jgi:hypothetical protein